MDKQEIVLRSNFTDFFIFKLGPVTVKIINQSNNSIIVPYFLHNFSLDPQLSQNEIILTIRQINNRIDESAKTIFSSKNSISSWIIKEDESHFFYNQLIDDANSILKMSCDKEFLHWNYFVSESNKNILETPFDSIFFQYCLTNFNVSLLHASAVFNKKHGLIFTGPSNRGKSTICSLFYQNGYEVIHDDKILLYEENNELIAENLPRYDKDVARKSSVNFLFEITGHEANNISETNNPKELIINNDSIVSYIEKNIF